jgi:Ca-activated chloride channel family protein
MNLRVQFLGFDFLFLEPAWFWLLLILPIWFVFRKFKRQGESSFLWTSRLPQEITALQSSWINQLKKALSALKIWAFIALVFALAGPYSWNNNDQKEDFKKGIDIVLALDVSLSMFSRDFEPNRLEAAKRVAKNFVSKRDGDRIGLVVYAGEAYTACPSTLDYQMVIDQIDEVSGEYIDQGTAIGTGLGTAVGRLQGDTLSSRVVILLTDGSNNRGELSPDEAAELAKATGVRVYTIGVGSNSEALSPVVTPFGIRFEKIAVEIDEETLKRVAERTGGEYFRAVDEEGLNSIYDKIDRLEKKRFLESVYQGEPPVDPTNYLFFALILFVGVWLVERKFFPYAQ